MPQSLPGNLGTIAQPRTDRPSEERSPLRDSRQTGSGWRSRCEFDGRTDLFVDSGRVGRARSRRITRLREEVTPGRRMDADCLHLSVRWEALALSGIGGQARRLTLREGRHHTPRFSPDGRFISFICDRVNEIDVVVISVDGTLQRVLDTGVRFSDGSVLVAGQYAVDLARLSEHVDAVGSECDSSSPRSTGDIP